MIVMAAGAAAVSARTHTASGIVGSLSVAGAGVSGNGVADGDAATSYTVSASGRNVYAAGSTATSGDAAASGASGTNYALGGGISVGGGEATVN